MSSTSLEATSSPQLSEAVLKVVVLLKDLHPLFPSKEGETRTWSQAPGEWRPHCGGQPFPQVCSVPSPDKSQQLVGGRNGKTASSRVFFPASLLLAEQAIGRQDRPPRPRATWRSLSLTRMLRGRRAYLPTSLSEFPAPSGWAVPLLSPLWAVPRYHLKTEGLWEVLERR